MPHRQFPSCWRFVVLAHSRPSYRPLHAGRAQKTEYQISPQTPSIVPFPVVPLFLSVVIFSRNLWARTTGREKSGQIFCLLINFSVYLLMRPKFSRYYHLTWQAVWVSAETCNGSLIWEWLPTFNIQPGRIRFALLSLSRVIFIIIFINTLDTKHVPHHS